MITYQSIAANHWGESVPAAPLAEAIHSLASKRFNEHIDIRKNGALLNVCASCHVSDRTVREWRNGHRFACQLGVADRALIGLDECWWMVWDPERFPDLYTPSHWIDVVDFAARAFEGEGCIGDDWIHPAARMAA